MQRIRDPLHDLIEFECDTDSLENMLWEIIQTQPFQRLRRIKQLGFSDLVYPGATHSRFLHSIGVFHTARHLMSVVERSVQRVEDSKKAQALTACLVHDLGHGPFSHAFEDVGKELDLPMARHEDVTEKIIKETGISDILKEGLGSGAPSDVSDMVRGVGQKTIYHSVVSSQFDADRLDYMRRDRLMTGSRHAGIDYKWLLANLETGKVPRGVDEQPVGEVETFVLGPKAIFGAEAYVLGLFQLYPTIYFHKATRSAEKIFSCLLKKLVGLVRDGSADLVGLPPNHPLIEFAKSPDNLETALKLDDSVVYGALSMMSEAEDPAIVSLATRLIERRLFKAVDVRIEVEKRVRTQGGDRQQSVALVDKICARVKENLMEWVDQNVNNVPRVLIDEADRTPYKSVEETEGPLDRINIRTATDQLVDLRDRSEVVAAVERFRLFRAYIDDDDEEARKAIDNFVQEETSK